MKIAIVGGAGRLGFRLAEQLHKGNHRVRIIDLAAPPWLGTMERVEFVHASLIGEKIVLARALRGVECVVHLAGLHGAHLAAGAPPKEVWTANVRGTSALVRAMEGGRVRRLVVASSTSIHGEGSQAGRPARIVDEQAPLQPRDVYDLSKIAIESVARHAMRRGVVEQTVLLRLGRFFWAGPMDYHLRKLSTGLDVQDAVGAIQLILEATDVPSDLYCVASDLPLTDRDRASLGVELPTVLDRNFPGLRDTLLHAGWQLPTRVGKSVSSNRLRKDLGYCPTRDLRWVAAQLPARVIGTAR